MQFPEQCGGELPELSHVANYLAKASCPTNWKHQKKNSRSEQAPILVHAAEYSPKLHVGWSTTVQRIFLRDRHWSPGFSSPKLWNGMERKKKEFNLSVRQPTIQVRTKQLLVCLASEDMKSTFVCRPNYVENWFSPKSVPKCLSKELPSASWLALISAFCLHLQSLYPCSSGTHTHICGSRCQSKHGRNEPFSLHATGHVWVGRMHCCMSHVRAVTSIHIQHRWSPPLPQNSQKVLDWHIERGRQDQGYCLCSRILFRRAETPQDQS